jgi:hypothetical protein
LALYNNTIGSNNFAQGCRTLNCNTTGCNNIAVGFLALYGNKGSNNTALGYRTLICNTTGNNNFAQGYCALGKNTCGANNIALGCNSLCVNTIGSSNIAIGAISGCAITTGTNNTIIGSLSGTAGLTCTLLLGAGTTERLKVDSTGLYINGSSYAPIYTINTQTGTTYTAVLSDVGKFVTFSNASAITLTIPLNSTVAYAVGTNIDIVQLGAGQVTIAGAAGVTINGTPGLKTRAQYSGASIIQIATNTWVAIGDLAA